MNRKSNLHDEDIRRFIDIVSVAQWEDTQSRFNDFYHYVLKNGSKEDIKSMENLFTDFNVIIDFMDDEFRFRYFKIDEKHSTQGNLIGQYVDLDSENASEMISIYLYG